jgi:hypothetical protein
VKFGNISIMFDAESGFENRISYPQCGSFGFLRFNLKICQQRCFRIFIDFLFFAPLDDSKFTVALFANVLICEENFHFFNTSLNLKLEH